jgi:glutathione S-transferase
MTPPVPATIRYNADGVANPFILYGWHLSYYTGKVRCYLRYKLIPFVDTPVDFVTVRMRVKRHTGATVMPVVVTPQAEWLQDSSAIIDDLVRRFPNRPVVPATPVRRFAAYLLETWGDAWWIPVAMHTRWSYPENYTLFERDGGAALLPHWPKFLRDRAVARVASNLRGYLPRVGVVPEQTPLLERWTRDTLDALDAHFAAHRFLLGDTPTIADFGLIGTMYGHLGRDPWPKRELVDPRPYLRAWIDRMAEPDASDPAPTNTSDDIPASLASVFRSIATEFLPMIEATLEAVNRHLGSSVADDDGVLPRGLDPISYPLGSGRYTRTAMPFMLWKIQRLNDVYRAMGANEQGAVRRWLETIECTRLLDLAIPHLRRVALQVAIDPLAQSRMPISPSHRVNA